ncbi:MAG: amino acid ABC transporter ATP-binding protein [Hyphomicrobiaceae bacterium]
MRPPCPVKFANVGKEIEGHVILRDVDLRLAWGTKYVICGPSGSGKSTLLRCINGLENVTTGTLEVLGVKASKREFANPQFRVKLGMVFQKFSLYPHLNVLDNLILAPMKVLKQTRRAATSKAERLLATVGLSDKISALPHQLSGGQQQRVAIARCLMMDPSILLFDEPTSALDPENIKEVLDVIAGLATEDRTAVVVTHEMGFARKFADTIIFMDGGSIGWLGSAEDFYSQGQTERIRRFLGGILH